MIQRRTALGDLVTSIKTLRQDGTIHEHVTLESEPLDVVDVPLLGGYVRFISDKSYKSSGHSPT